MEELVPPPNPPAPVVVTPIPATQSRTLWLTKVLSWLSPVIAFVPDLIGFFLEQWMTNDAFAAALTNAVPMRYRVAMAMIIFGLAQRYGQLRRDTSAPIAGTPLAESLPQATPSTHTAPTQR